jgi:hypothetical protein
MGTQPTNLRSESAEDYRISQARQTLAESKNASAPDTDDGRPAAHWWGRTEHSLGMVLEVIDEGSLAEGARIMDVDLENSSLDDLYGCAEKATDELKRQMEKVERMLDTIRAMKARDAK